jgi:RNA polymerase sigma-70 factor (ECF subfamily)
MDNLARRLARGEPAAFAELYDAGAGRIHHYLVVRLGSRADADDVLQETFVCLARTRKKLAGVENLMAYVFATARNESTRLMERLQREDRKRAHLSPDSLFQDSRSSLLSERETAEWVTAALQRLSDELREVVELKIYAELTFREISEVTGVPQGTVATRYRTALEKLRGELVKECE